MITRGTCLGASLVCIFVCADDLPTGDETGPAAEGVCGTGILMCVFLVNVFTAVEEHGKGLKQQRLTLGSSRVSILILAHFSPCK